MVRLLLLRHAESEWNAAGRWQGQADTPLTERGRSHAAEAGELLADFEMVVCSDLARARQSALIIAEGAGIGGVTTEPRLRERDAGPWQGLTRDEIEEGWPGYLSNGHRPAGYEPDAELAARTDPALRDVAAEASRRGLAEALVITHGGVIHHLVTRAGLVMVRMPNLSGRWVSVADGSITVGDPVAVGDAASYSAVAVEAGNAAPQE